MVTFREAAVRVLQVAKEPLTPRQITERAIEMGLLLDTKSKNPVATMAGIICQRQKANKDKGVALEFVTVDGGKIILGADQSPTREQHGRRQETGSSQAPYRHRETSAVRRKPKVKTSYVGRAGEHLVVAELLFNGINASTMSVDEGIDVVATWGDLTYKFQVKTANLGNEGSYSYTIPVNAFRKANRDNVYYVFILRNDDQTDFLVLPYSQLKKEIDERRIRQVSGQSRYACKITQKGDRRLYLGKQDNDVTYYRRRWPSPDDLAHGD